MTDTETYGRFFLPGPTEVHPDVLAAQTRPMIGHRGPGIVELMQNIEPGLKAMFQTERPVIVSTSSASGLMEAAVRNGVAGGKVLSLVNGAFSSRFSKIAMACGHDVERWEVEWGQVHSPDELADRLARSEFDAVTLSQSETSTGALQDLEAISDVVRQHERALLLVDSVTGVGGAETHTDEWGPDFILTGSQKAVALPPGLAFAVASEAMMERSRNAEAKGWYFDLVDLVDQGIKYQSPATPAVSLLYALEAQVERILAEGMKARWQRHLDMQQRTFEWIDEMNDAGVGLGVFAAEGHRSPTVTCVTMPGGTGSPELVERVESAGWVIGGGYGKLSDSTFRIGHMGDHTVEELDGLLDVISEALK
ncbi:MAG: alanine--glyoxylate aminotransferase family protein [Actinobacteria bacterium]|nr:MAG: alanine--glyoxylate aminotransferase family protein [Actinomycetota bacterium]REK37059.1 MAG: alanine--glyoxylate aminotransferase family protein [Actinomycetota bacterium]